MKLVKSRQSYIDKKNYKEKVDHEFAPYAALQDMSRIESEMWSRCNGAGLKSLYAWLRNRFCFLLSFCGILRCESLFKAELSDLLSIQMQKPKDPHPLFVLILQMATGKSCLINFIFLKIN